jgi:LPS export ABC transporter protein LptC
MIFRNPRNLLWSVPLVLFLTSPLWKPAVASFLEPRGGFQPPTSITIEKSPAQDFIMDTVTITLSNQGRVEWVVNAQRAFTAESDKDIGMIEVDAVYTSVDGLVTRITSSRGRYQVDKRHLTLIDDVVIRKPALKQEMYTDLLHYYDATKMAVSPEDLEIIGPDFSIQAGRMDYDLANDGYDFSNRVIVDF